MAHDVLDFSWIVGSSVREIELYAADSWTFWFEPNGNLNVGCFWRILDAGQIVVTSKDHGQLFGLNEPIDASKEGALSLAAARVTGMSIADGTSDLQIEFERARVLQVITTSACCENWTLHEPSGRTYIALGGGELATFMSRTEDAP